MIDYEKLSKAALIELHLQKDEDHAKEALLYLQKDEDHAELVRLYMDLVAQVTKINEQLKKHQRITFGKKSERLKNFITDLTFEDMPQDDSQQEALQGDNATQESPANGVATEAAPVIDVLQSPTAASETRQNNQVKKRYSKPHPGRSKFDPSLKRVYIYLDPEGKQEDWGDLVDTLESEQLVTEINTYVLVRVRRKYCKNGIFKIGNIPTNDIFFKHRMHQKTVAFSLMMRYALHTPYYRIMDLIAEPTLTYNTLVETSCKGANALLPLAPVMLDEVKYNKSPETTLGVDEFPFDALDTPVKITVFKGEPGAEEPEDVDSTQQELSEMAKEAIEQGQNTTGAKKIIHKGRVWVIVNPEVKLVYYHYTASREKRHPEQFLKGYVGPIMTDAYAAYLSIAENPEFAIILMLCWAHARRRFTDLIIDNKRPDPVAVEIVRLIGLLYKVEEKIKNRTLEEKLEARKESKNILEVLKNYMDEKIKLYTPKESMYDAINYLLKNWNYFIQYTDLLGGIIDNNFTERQVRPGTITRKNSLFFGSVKCAEGSALMFSLVQSCKLNGVNIYDYLTDVLGRIATHPKDKLVELLPHNWKPPNKSDPL